MKQQSIYVPVQIDAAAFRRFALFDTYARQKRWRGPAVFAAILTVSAAICYTQHARRGAVLLGTVLLLVGLGLPAVWYFSYEMSLRAQIKRMRLATPQRAYTLVFRDGGIEVTTLQGKQKSALAWDSIVEVYRRKGCTYLYFDAAHAYLLPHSQVEGGEPGLWEMIQNHVPASRCFDQTH